MSWKKAVSIFDSPFMFHCFDLYYVYVTCTCTSASLGHHILKGKLTLFKAIHLYEYILSLRIKKCKYKSTFYIFSRYWNDLVMIAWFLTSGAKWKSRQYNNPKGRSKRGRIRNLVIRNKTKFLKISTANVNLLSRITL